MPTALNWRRGRCARAGESARFPRRLPLPRGQGEASLRREGPVAEEAHRLALRGGSGQRQDGSAAAVLPRNRDDRDPHGARGAAPREHPHQEASPPVQRVPAGRQDLSVHQDHDGRGVAAGPRHAAGPGGRTLLLRPVLGRPGAPDHADDHPALPDSDLHAGDRREAAKALPLLRSPRLPGPLRRRPDEPGGVRRRGRRRDPLPPGPERGARIPPHPQDAGGLRRGELRDGRGLPRLPAHRAGRGRAPGRPVAAGGERRRLRLLRIGTGRGRGDPRRARRRPPGPSRLLLREVAGDRAGVPSSRPSCPSFTTRTRSFRPKSTCPSTSPTPGFSRTSWPRAAARRSRCGCPSGAPGPTA